MADVMMARLTPEKAWDALKRYRYDYYDGMSAMYSGEHDKLRATGREHTFWRRSNCNCRIHVPIAADIAATSAALLFSQPPQIEANDANGESDVTAQNRLAEIMAANDMQGDFNEAAETAAVFGDVYFKLGWNDAVRYPLIDAVQPDAAWPEYRRGSLQCIHFFTEVDDDEGRVTRIYECYSRGRIDVGLYVGDAGNLGKRQADAMLEAYGLSAEIKAPVDEMLAVHIANVRPNRRFRGSRKGRSDLDALRDLCDALDETYSSWVRDVRLAKARTIVPVEYMKRKPQNMVDGLAQAASWEFDPDVETYVAMDIDPEKSPGITTQQFEIRAEEHMKTCAQLTHDIVSMAGYSPQTFGMDINGTAQSGTALTIREKKSLNTRDKKLTYWQAPIEAILTAFARLDAALNKGAGCQLDTRVCVAFPDIAAADISTVAAAVQMLNNAQAASIETKVAMQHPNWSSEQQAQEVERIRAMYAMNAPVEDPMLGDDEADEGEAE